MVVIVESILSYWILKDTFQIRFQNVSLGIDTLKQHLKKLDGTCDVQGSVAMDIVLCCQSMYQTMPSKMLLLKSVQFLKKKKT